MRAASFVGLAAWVGSLIGASASSSSSAGAAEPITFYVSPLGHDSWTGRLPNPNADRTDGPLASLTRARDLARQLRTEAEKAGESRGIDVVLRGGRHMLRETLVFRPEDSGSAAAPTTYRNYPGETPVVSGGRAIGSWQIASDGLWATDLPSAEPAWHFQQLWIDGGRRTRARTPSRATGERRASSYFRTEGPLAPLTDREAARRDVGAKISFRYGADDLRDWKNRNDVQLVVYHAWTASRHHIEHLDTTARTVRFTAPSGWPIGWWEARQRYYVDNIREGLDEPGEWYLDRSERRLYYKPLPGEQPERVAAVAPVLTELVKIAGDPDAGRLVKNLRFVGLSFQHADWRLARDEPCDGQAAAFLQSAAVMARGAVECEFRQCEIAHVGAYALWLERGCRDNRIEQCHMHDLGAGAIRIGESGQPTAARQTSGNVVYNCFLRDGGHVYPAGVGVLIQRSSHNQVTHCEICDFDYTGVSVGWTWGYAPSAANHNVIEANHIHHLGRGELSDLAGIYTLGISPGSVLRRNVIHDVLSYDYGGWGLYTDEGSSEMLLENNIVYRTKTGGFHQHYGQNNVIRNNVFALSAEGQIQRTRDEPHRSFTFERNIVYYSQGQLLSSNWAGAAEGHYTLDRNVYWRTDGGDVLFPGDATFAEWQARGQDRNSVIADPKFADPARHDYRLQADSPALQLGFQPIDTSDVGLIGPEEWRSLASQVARPPLVFPGPPPPFSLRESFTETPVGAPPATAISSGADPAKNAGIRVVELLDPNRSPNRVLEIADAAGLKQVWQPHFYYQPDYRLGTARLAFSVRLEAGADLVHEWRDAANPYRVGPSVRFRADKPVVANGRELPIVCPSGRWFQVALACKLGRGADGTYQLVLSDGTKPWRSDNEKCQDAEFRSLRWLGFISAANAKTTSYLDDISLQRAD